MHGNFNTKSLALGLLITLGLIACKKSGDGGVLPNMSIGNSSGERSSSSAVYRFTVSLDAPATSEVTASYTTVDGTAKSGKDYTTASGTVRIASGQSQATIEVTVSADSLRRESQQFFVQLSAPKGCVIQSDRGTGTISNQNLLYYPVDPAGYSGRTNYAGYTLVWNDEFNGNEVNTNNWTFELGNNNGWGNNELESYTASTNNAFVSAGNLIIEARQERVGNFNYTSARMITKGKKEFKWGRVDIRAKLPKGKGIWPALWMLGSNISTVNWPACGEIDILELLGQEPSKIYASLHWGPNTSGHRYDTKSYVATGSSFDQQFHLYSMIWDASGIKILVDDQEFQSLSKAAFNDVYPFDNPFFFIFNIAVGGNWPGSPDATTVFPQRMAIDYIRVYQ
jgi:hypothetical protein